MENKKIKTFEELVVNIIIGLKDKVLDLEYYTSQLEDLVSKQRKEIADLKADKDV